jgi:hypothetical protein
MQVCMKKVSVDRRQKTKIRGRFRPMPLLGFLKEG